MFCNLSMLKVCIVYLYGILVSIYDDYCSFIIRKVY